MASENVYETALDLPSRGMTSSLPQNVTFDFAMSAISPCRNFSNFFLKRQDQKHIVKQYTKHHYLAGQGDPPLPSRAMTSTTPQNGTNHYISDSHGKFKKWINSRLHVILTIIIVVLLVFIAVVTGKLIYLENVIEEQENRMDILMNTNNLTVVPSDVTDTLRNELKDLNGKISNLFNDLSREKQARQSKEAELEGKINHELRQEKETKDTELVEMRTNISRALRDEMNKEKQARQALAGEMEGEINQMKAHNSKSFSVAFHAVVSETHPTINLNEKVKFDISKLNIGNGYDPTTGVFTVPAGSGGLYFFSTHLVIDDGKKGSFYLKKSDEYLCGFYEDNSDSSNEDGTGSCSATVQLSPGDQVFVTRRNANSGNPVECSDNLCGFTGFLMKPTN